jgi:hypothetical protein
MLWDLPCDLNAETSSAIGPGGTDRQFLRCELTLRLQALNEQGFQPLDLESYQVSDEGRWAVLLREKKGLDWLQIDTSTYFASQRNFELNGGANSSVDSTLTQTLFGLRKVVIFYIPALSIHNGLVHDGGTAGPPGG